MALRRSKVAADRRGTASSLIILGLANPGSEYEGSRHNVGGDAVRLVATRRGASLSLEKRQRAMMATVTTPHGPVTLAVPTTFMNESGAALPPLMQRTSMTDPMRVVVAHDELDLPPGVARFKLGGGHGGHNGLRDTITHIGANFWRLRLGVGHPGDKSEVIDFVLQCASAKEEELILTALQAAMEQVPVFLEKGAEKAMHLLHTQTGKSV